jgi:hypothetical protein
MLAALYGARLPEHQGILRASTIVRAIAQIPPLRDKPAALVLWDFVFLDRAGDVGAAKDQICVPHNRPAKLLFGAQVSAHYRTMGAVVANVEGTHGLRFQPNAKRLIESRNIFAHNIEVTVVAVLGFLLN